MSDDLLHVRIGGPGRGGSTVVSGQTHYVIAYDIADDKRRSRVVKELKAVGYRVQYSIFEADLTDAQLVTLRARLNRIINNTKDSVIYYSRCRHCRNHVIRDGVQVDPLNDEDMFFV